MGRPWLHIANIKENWRKNLLTFRKAKTKIKVSTQDKVATTWDSISLDAEFVNTFEGLDDGEVIQYFDENPRIIPLFEIDVVDIITPSMSNGEKDVEEPLDDKTLIELRLQQEAMETEIHVSGRVQVVALEELNLADIDMEQQTMLIAKEMKSSDKTKLTELQRQYKDVFVWSFEDMRGLNPTFLSTSN